jgi:hypothetical protein
LKPRLRLCQKNSDSNDKNALFGLHPQIAILATLSAYFLFKNLKLKLGQTFCAVDTTPTNLKFGLSVFDSFT